jgi:NAD(P)-dependent dehydrogenase (short-subunit alcohol dehydrogenase family)
MSLEKKRILIFGGSSGIGLATAQTAALCQAEVIIAGRSQEKLEAARRQIAGSVRTLAVDLTDAAGIEQALSALGPIDHLVVAGSSTSPGSVGSIEVAAARAAFDSKFWGAFHAVRHARFNAGGSVVLFSGIFSRRPSPGYSTLAAVNGAVEAFGRALALELAPIRVNVVSPGLTDTPAYAALPEGQRQGYFAAVAGRLPVKRVGRPADIAAAVLHLLTNGYTTGAVVDVDGGALLV